MATDKKAKAVTKLINAVAFIGEPKRTMFGFSLVNKYPKYNGNIEEVITNE